MPDLTAEQPRSGTSGTVAAPASPVEPAFHRDRPAAESLIRAGLTVFLPFAAGYFLSYLYRSVNAVIADDLTASLDLDGTALGLLTATYFITFAAIQVPLGMLLDRFGPRRVEAVLLVIAAAGATLFSVAEGLTGLVMGRGLIGLGVSACLMAAMKSNATWWPKPRLPLVNGLIMAFGGLGAFAATTPVHLLLTVTGWRGVFQVLAGLTLLCALYLWLAVPEPLAAPGGHDGWRAQWRGTLRVFASPFFWRLVPVTVLVQSSFMAYQGLWAGPWLRDLHGFDREAVAGHLQLIPMAMIAGYVGTGLLVDRLSRRGVPPVAVFGVLIGLFVANQVVLLIPALAVPAVQWALFGLFGSASVLAYSILTQAFPVAVAGRVNTALNVLTFIAASLAQTGIGAVLGRFHHPAGGFTPDGHRLAMGVLAALTLTALGWFLWPRRRRPDPGTVPNATENAG